MARHKPLLGFLFAASALLAGCGGSDGSSFTATVTGLVTDVDGRPVRGAKVMTDGASTTTTTRGLYVLQGVETGNRIVKAEIEQNGIMYRGQNLSRNFDGQLTQSVNIAIAPSGSLGSFEGYVRDRNGTPLQDANVLAYGGGLSSARAITDKQGHYEIPGMIPGIEYTLNAGGRTYSSDYDFATIRDRENLRIDFVLGDANFAELDPPQNVIATSWVSPRGTTRLTQESGAYESIKRFYNPKRAARQTRNTVQGNPIEIDVEWDAIDDNDLLGFGVYRSSQAAGAAIQSTFLSDPLAIFFADADPVLFEGGTYTYYVTSLTTLFPDDPESESAPSNSTTVRTLSDLTLGGVTNGPLKFSWQGGSGADEYVVFVFDQYPGIGVSSVWNNDANPTAELFVNYSGPRLISGGRYYYIVLGRSADGSARTLSRVGDFIAPTGTN